MALHEHDFTLIAQPTALNTEEITTFGLPFSEANLDWVIVAECACGARLAQSRRNEETTNYDPLVDAWREIDGKTYDQTISRTAEKLGFPLSENPAGIIISAQ